MLLSDRDRECPIGIVAYKSKKKQNGRKLAGGRSNPFGGGLAGLDYDDDDNEDFTSGKDKFGLRASVAKKKKSGGCCGGKK